MTNRQTPLLELKNVNLTFDGPSGKIKILEKVDLTANAGESMSIVGPSGAGKTSLLMLISGLEKPTGGRISINGHDITDMNEDELALFRRHNLSIVFQAFRLLPTMTALENVALPLELDNKSHAKERAKEALDAVGLSHRMDHYPSQLSGGEQQRVSLARAFIIKPALLLADEPTGNLDGTNGEKVMKLLFDLCEEEKTTLVLVTHDMELARRSKRLVRIADGKLQDKTHKAA